MYSLVFGDEGVNAVIRILRDEIAQNLRLLGGTQLSHITLDMVNARALELNIYDGVYETPRSTELVGVAKL